MSEFKQLILKGIAWSAGAQIGKQALGFFITMILMRLLSPSDFGLMGMVTVFTGFAWLFSAFGFGDALIQSQVVEERHYSSVFWLNILISIILMGTFLLAAPAIAHFYKEPRLVALILISSFIFPIGSLSGVQHSILTKKLEFKKIGIIETFSMIVAGVAAILIAYSGYGVYALVWKIFIHTSLRVIIVWIVSAWTPRLIFDFKAIKDLMGFSLNLFGLQIFNYWVRNADNLLIGKFIGSSGLGIYSRAYSLMLLPVVQVNRVLGRVIFSALSKIQEDKRRIKSIYLRAIYSIGLISFPLMLGLAVVSKEFILVLFGPKWEAAIPVLQVLCLVGLFQSIASTTGWIYNSQGKTDLHFKWGIFGGILTFIAFSIGINWGVMGVAVAYLIRVYGISYFHLAIPAKLINLTFKEIIQRLSGIFFAALLMAVIVWGIGLILPVHWSLWGQLALKVCSGAIIYITLLYISGQWVRIRRELIFSS